MHDGAATRRGLQRHREPRSTSFRSAACPLSPAGHCAARGPRVHHRLDHLADWPRPAVRFPIKCSNHELSYALLARARESFELCSHFKSLPPVPDRELSADLTWRARRRKPEFPALGSGTQSRCVQGEWGVDGNMCPIAFASARGNSRVDCFGFGGCLSLPPLPRSGEGVWSLWFDAHAGGLADVSLTQVPQPPRSPPRLVVPSDLWICLAWGICPASPRVKALHQGTSPKGRAMAMAKGS